MKVVPTFPQKKKANRTSTAWARRLASELRQIVDVAEIAADAAVVGATVVTADTAAVAAEGTNFVATT